MAAFLYFSPSGRDQNGSRLRKILFPPPAAGGKLDTHAHFDSGPSEYPESRFLYQLDPCIHGKLVATPPLLILPRWRQINRMTAGPEASACPWKCTCGQGVIVHPNLIFGVPSLAPAICGNRSFGFTIITGAKRCVQSQPKETQWPVQNCALAPLSHPSIRWMKTRRSRSSGTSN